MSADPLILDPEFEALLREVAADPNSTLLRIARPKVVRGFFEREEAASASDTGLSAAERHLVQVHRNELAWLLHRAAFTKLLDGQGTTHFVSRHGPTGEDHSQLEAAELQTRVHQQDINSELDERRVTALELLRRCVRQPSSDLPTAVELAAASHRLQPSNQARLVFVVDLGCRGLSQSALQATHFILASRPTREHATRAWECAGLAYAKQLRFQAAHDAYRKGCLTDDQHTYMNRLEFALQVGDRGDTLESARRVNELAPRNAPCVEWFIDGRRRRRLAGEWSPTREGRALAADLIDSIDGAAGRIVHGVL
jgi:hypothetical protein